MRYETEALSEPRRPSKIQVGMRDFKVGTNMEPVEEFLDTRIVWRG